MSWLKKTVKKAFKKPNLKSLKRVLSGKVHMRSNLKRINKLLPKAVHLKSWSQLKKKLGLSNLLSPSNSYNYSSVYSGYNPSGYVYRGRSISEMV